MRLLALRARSGLLFLSPMSIIEVGCHSLTPDLMISTPEPYRAKPPTPEDRGIVSQTADRFNYDFVKL